MQFTFAFDLRPLVRIESVLNIFNTLFVCVVLGSGALLFSKDANALVLNPIERMIGKMEKIRENPLAAMRLGDDEYKREEMERRKQREQKSHSRCWKMRHGKKLVKEPM